LATWPSDNKGNAGFHWAYGNSALAPCEIKSCATFSTGLLKGISRIKKLMDNALLKTFLIYNGQPFQRSDKTAIFYFRDAALKILRPPL
jgi:hypothetical protein